MEYAPATPDEIADLLTRLDEFAQTLSDEQKVLLYAMIKIAVEVVQVDELIPIPSFASEFSSAFTPGTAALIVSYAKGHAARSVVTSPGYVTKNPPTTTPDD